MAAIRVEFRRQRGAELQLVSRPDRQDIGITMQNHFYMVISCNDRGVAG